jgi:hypothetical protein
MKEREMRKNTSFICTKKEMMKTNKELDKKKKNLDYYKGKMQCMNINNEYVKKENHDNFPDSRD